jgi:7-alpha-hydroxysteroid dehydrogenase
MSNPTLDLFRLDGRVALITGAGKGIGEGIAYALADAGADVAILARTASDLDRVADGVRARGRRVVAFPGDVLDASSIGAFVDTTLAELGGIDVVVNNAGGANSKPFLQTTQDDLEWAFRFNVSSAFVLTQLATPHMLARGGGAVVNIASVTGIETKRATLSYGTAKAALVHMTRLMAADLAPKIRVNCVLPGAIETPSLKDFLERLDPETRRIMVERTPMRRNGQPIDIAAAVLYFASPAASWVSGKILDVDGMAWPEFIPKNIPDLE